MKKIALITGASAGIGRALAHKLASDGWHLGLMARREELLGELKKELVEKFPSVIVETAVLDVKQYDTVANVVNGLADKLGGIDLFIANAGVGVQTPAWKNHFPAIRDILETNLIGAIATVEAARDVMLARGSGHIVGISSVAGFRGLPTSSGYSTSKVALTAYLDAIRMDLKHRNISVTSIHPGFIETFMTQKNKYKMPFLMTADRAAGLICKAIAQKKARLIFPWQMKILITLMRLLPDGLYDYLLSRPIKGVTR
jgi:short-subunit dehydrogenase